MVVGWALLAYAAFQLVCVAVVSLMSLWPLESSGSRSNQDARPPPNRFRKRDVVVDTAPATSSTGGTGDSDMVLRPMVRRFTTDGLYN
jgi:hypothetical protein